MVCIEGVATDRSPCDEEVNHTVSYTVSNESITSLVE